MVTTHFEPISKERVADLRFPSSEVLKKPQEVSARKNDLDRALSLGNLEHSKMRIYFEDDTNTLMVETTVWGVTDKSVILKRGVVIPIHRIHSITL